MPFPTTRGEIDWAKIGSPADRFQRQMEPLDRPLTTLAGAKPPEMAPQRFSRSRTLIEKTEIPKRQGKFQKNGLIHNSLDRSRSSSEFGSLPTAHALHSCEPKARCAPRQRRG
jgi:hypothetical protein